MSLAITLSSDVAIATDPGSGNDAANFLTTFIPPIDLGSLDYEVAMFQFDGWFTTFNIHSGNAQITWTKNASTFVISVPDGNYSVQDLNALLQESEQNNAATGNNAITGAITYGVQIIPDFNTNKVVIVIDNTVGPATYTLDLTGAGNLAYLLGFVPTIVATTTQGSLEPNFNDGVDQWQIRCDLQRNSYDNGVESDILFNFVPQVPPSAHITISPLHLNYFQVNKSLINSIRIRFTDQDNNQLNFNGQNTVVTLKIRKIGTPGD